MNLQLFNFHPTGASTRGRGEFASSQIVCKSWNRGRCSAPYAQCRFSHRCSSCSWSHRASACPSRASTTSKEIPKRIPHPQHLHVAAASPDAPEVVLSFLLAFAPRLLGLVVFCSAIVLCCYMLGVGLAMASLSIKSCFIV